MVIVLLGLALVAAVVGVCWVAAEHKCLRNIPEEIWFLPGAVGGVFVGAMLPFAPWRRENDIAKTAASPWARLKQWARRVRWGSTLGGVAVGFACLAAILLAGHFDRSLALYAVATTLGGVMLGLPIPSPGRRDP